MASRTLRFLNVVISGAPPLPLWTRRLDAPSALDPIGFDLPYVPYFASDLSASDYSVSVRLRLITFYIVVSLYSINPLPHIVMTSHPYFRLYP